ncbi:MAG: lysophospholipid acyltransferase family protein [Planctomycetes bacterium]|nr:lysophospholipid acyltransferase family protein [Planctomycetota bacterium]
MPERWTRKARVRGIELVAATAEFAPEFLLQGALRGASELARFSRFEAQTRANLELAFGPGDHRRIARGVRAHTARLVREWLMLSRAATGEKKRATVERWIREHVEFDRSYSHVEELARAGRGVLIATAHLGNWELLATALRLRGLDGAVVARHKPNDPIAKWFTRTRGALGVETIDQNAPPRRVLEVLRKGGVLGLLADLAPRRLAGETLTFFGAPALAMTAPAALARAAKVPILPARCVADGSRYRLKFDKPLFLDAALPHAAARTELTQRLQSVFEHWIRETPEQWAWHQPRWSLERSRRAR